MSELEDRIAAREKTLGVHIESRIAAREAELAKNETKTPFIDRMGQQFFDNTIGQVLSFPGEVAAKGIAGTEAALEGGVSVLTGGDFDFNRRANRNMQLPPFAQLNNLPRLTHNEASAAVKQGSESIANLPLSMGRQVHVGSDLLGTERQPNVPAEPFSSRFNEDLARLNQEQARVDEEHPFKTGAGRIAGDVATLFSGRAPFLSSIDKAESFLAGKKFLDVVKNPNITGEFANIVRGVMDSSPMRKLMRGSGRAGEAGFEAAMLEMIHGNDPGQTAAYVAGGQAVGSLLLSAHHSVGSGGVVKGGLKFAGLAAAYTGLIQMMKATTPGGENNLIDSGEEAFNHIVMLMLAGGVATAAGAGRTRGNFDANYPVIGELFSTLPRANMLSMIAEYRRSSPDEQQTVDATLKQLGQDPEFFGPEITQRLNDALEAGTLVEILREPL